MKINRLIWHGWQFRVMEIFSIHELLKTWDVINAHNSITNGLKGILRHHPTICNQYKLSSFYLLVIIEFLPRNNNHQPKIYRKQFDSISISTEFSSCDRNASLLIDDSTTNDIVAVVWVSESWRMRQRLCHATRVLLSTVRQYEASSASVHNRCIISYG